MKERLALLISGGGTTMQEIVKACQQGEIDLDVACIISSSESAGGIEKARNLGISDKNILVINPGNFRKDNGKIDNFSFGDGIISELQKRDVTLITQNGWMPLTPENVIEAYSKRIFNQHPGPVPEFGGKGMYGRRVHSAVLIFRRLTNGPLWSEVIGQRVDMEYDRGVVVKSKKVDILSEDTVDDLQQRALPVEHKVQIEMLKDYISGNLKEQLKKTLVKKGEKETLELAKKIAKILYPKG